MSTSSPKPGDVLVVRASQSADQYVVSTVPGPAQFFSETRDHAIQEGQRFAAKAGVDLWYRPNEKEYVLLRRFRDQ